MTRQRHLALNLQLIGCDKLTIDQSIWLFTTQLITET